MFLHNSTSVEEVVEVSLANDSLIIPHISLMSYSMSSKLLPRIGLVIWIRTALGATSASTQRLEA